MVIKKAVIKNFKKIKELTYTPNKKVNIRTGKNGKGKTTFLEAIRYGLTGELPEDPVRYGTNEMSVYIELDDETNFERGIRQGVGTVKVNGKKTTAKSLNELLMLKTGIPQAIMKITSSAELSASLRPDELGTLLLKYIPDEQDIDSVISFLKGIPQEIYNDVISEISMLFPEMPDKFGTEMINEVYETVFSIRKDFKKERDISAAKVSSFIGEKPKEKIEDLKKVLNDLIKTEGAQEIQQSAIKAYNDAVENRKKQEEQIKKLEERINLNKSTKPNPDKLEVITKKLNEIEKKKTETIKIIQTLKNDISFLDRTLENLNKPICPLSDKLTCSTDKTQIKAEIEELQLSNKEGLEYQENVLKDLTTQENAEKENKEKFLDNQTKYNEKVVLIEQLNTVKNNLIPIPQRPELKLNDLDVDISTRKKQIQDLLDKAKKYEEHIRETKKLEALELKVKIYDTLVKVLAPKGPVMEGIIGYYLPIFETACNQKASALKPGFSIKLIYDDGIVITCEVESGIGYREYSSLSNGEKILVQFLLLDMLNSLTGFRIMILDSLDQLDNEAFKSLIELVSNDTVQNEYDHIFIAAVDHDDTIKTLKAIKDIEWEKL